MRPSRTRHGGRWFAPARGRRRAFTLVELLVVVAIIALLISILMPVLANAKEIARRSVCMSNQSGISKALNVYAGQWNTFPYNYADFHSDPWWYQGLGTPLPLPEATLAHDYGPFESIWDQPSLNVRANKDRVNERMALGCLSKLCGGPVGIAVQASGSPVPVPGNFWNADEKDFPKLYVCPSANLNLVYLWQAADKYHACYWTNIAIRLNMGWGGKAGGGDFKTAGNPIGSDQFTAGRSWVRWACPTPGCSRRTVYNPKPDQLPLPADTIFSGDTNETELIPDGVTSLYPGDFHLQIAPGFWGLALEYTRHKGKLVTSYTDGHARVFSQEEINANPEYLKLNNGNPSGANFLIKYPPAWNCSPANLQKHYVPIGPIN